MMLCYVAVPARIVGVEKKAQSRRDTLAASAVGGAVGAVVCSPPYMLGRLGILMLGWPYVFWLGVILIVVGSHAADGRHQCRQGGQVLGQARRPPVPRWSPNSPPLRERRQSATSASVSPLTASRAASDSGLRPYRAASAAGAV